MWQTSNQKWTSVAKSWDTICTFSARHGTVLGLEANGTKIKWVRFGRSNLPPFIDPFYDGNWKAELGMTTKIVPGKPWARFGSRKRDLSAAEPCAAEMADQELVEPGCQF